MEQKAILLETQYFPSIHYFSKLVRFPNVILEQHENYAKGSYRNRCHIAGPNGLQRLSIPLQKGKNEQMPIREVRISYTDPWQRHHAASIKTAYGNAPFFEHYADEIFPVFTKKQTFLFDYNLMLLKTIAELIQIEISLKFSESYQQVAPASVLDFRNRISPKGKSMTSDNYFQVPEYAQVFREKNGFLANLSILDLLFCTGPQTSYILENCVPQ